MARRPKPWFRKARKCWYVIIDGVQHNLGPAKKAAFARFYQLMRQGHATRKSWAAVADAFLDWLEKNRSLDTFEWYRYRLERFCLRYPNLRSHDIRSFHLQQWVDEYPELSRTSRRNYLRVVKRCCKWAVQQGYLTENPVQYLEVPTAERREVLISPDDFEQLLRLTKDDGFHDLLVTTWETGCRPQESLRVEARHVDLSHERWIFPPHEAKGNRQPRVVYLSARATEISRRLMQQFPCGPLFRNSAGRPWTPDAVNCAFDRLRVRIFQKTDFGNPDVIEREMARLLPQLAPNRIVGGKPIPKSTKQLRDEARRKVLARLTNKVVPRFSLYALRHSWATRALESGLDGLTVAILMGHSDPSTLARVYQHLAHNPSLLLKQARQVGS